MNALRISGMTGAGKTTLARSFIASEIKQGRSVMVVLPIAMMARTYDRQLFDASIPQRSAYSYVGVRCSSVNTMLRDAVPTYESFVLEEGVRKMIMEHQDRNALMDVLNRATMVVSIETEFDASLWATNERPEEEKTDAGDVSDVGVRAPIG